MVLDLGVLHRDAHAVSFRESLVTSALYVVLAVGFAAVVYALYNGPPPQGSIDQQILNAPSDAARAWTAVQLYLTGYIVEYTLAMDNVFVIGLIFTYSPCRASFSTAFFLGHPRRHPVARDHDRPWRDPHRARGMGALSLRGLPHRHGREAPLTAGNAEEAMKENFLIRWMRGHMRITQGLRGQSFFVREPEPKTGKTVLWATPLFLCLVMVEFADVIFAVDSVPAIFLITQDPSSSTHRTSSPSSDCARSISRWPRWCIASTI